MQALVLSLALGSKLSLKLSKKVMKTKRRIVKRKKTKRRIVKRKKRRDSKKEKMIRILIY